VLRPVKKPPCGVRNRPASAAIRNAGAKSSIRPSRSSLESPNPVTPAPEYRAARRASLAAWSPDLAQLDAMTTPIGIGAAAAAASTASTAASSPPSIGAYDVGSTWSSDQPQPPAASSSAASRTTRATSSTVRMAARAAS
jgi:CO/xanthine dehydrogenase Mo-binding subunit